MSVRHTPKLSRVCVMLVFAVSAVFSQVVLKDTVTIEPKNFTQQSIAPLVGGHSPEPLYQLYVDLGCYQLADAGISNKLITAKVGEIEGVVQQRCATCYRCYGEVIYRHPDVFPKSIPFQLLVEGSPCTLVPQTNPNVFTAIFNGKKLGVVKLLGGAPLEVRIYCSSNCGWPVYVDTRQPTQPNVTFYDYHSTYFQSTNPTIQWYPSNVINVDSLVPMITEEGLDVTIRATATLRYATATDSITTRCIKLAPASLYVGGGPSYPYTKKPVPIYAAAFDQRGRYYYYDLPMDEPMQVTVDSAQYGIVRSNSGQTGRSIVVPWQELYDGTVWFIPQGAIVRTTSMSVTVSMVNKPSVKGTDIITYEPELHHLVLRTVPDTIEHGQQSKLYVQMQDSDSNDVEFPWPTMLFRIYYADTTYGKLMYVPTISATTEPLQQRESDMQENTVTSATQNGINNGETALSKNLLQTIQNSDTAHRLSTSASLTAVAGPLYIETTYREANTGKIVFDASGKTPSYTETVTLTANSDYSATGAVVVRGGPSLDHFDVTFDSSTIAYTEASKMYVQAKDVNNNNIDLPADQQVTVSVTTNTDYGTFIDPNGDTVNTTPAVLQHMRYGDAKAGRILFAAVTKNPDTPVACKARVALERDQTKTGEKSITVVEQTLKIVMNGSHEVEPRNLRGRRTAPDPTQVNRKEFTVIWTRGGIPCANKQFHLVTEYVEKTGGHDHTSPKRTRSNENYGHFYLVQPPTHLTSQYNDGKTQDDGKEQFQYIASIFGDKMTIKVEAADENTKNLLWDTVSVVEKVAGLILLEDGDDYDLVGGTKDHHGPPTYTENNNHYATADVLRNIQNIATAYHEKFPDDVVLQINDMSLPYGGRFDIWGKWKGNSDHKYHRQGTDIDIRSTAIPDDDTYEDENKNGRYDKGENITSDLNGNGKYDYTNTAFEKICKNNGVTKPKLEHPGVEGKEHYHLYFFDYKN